MFLFLSILSAQLFCLSLKQTPPYPSALLYHGSPASFEKAHPSFSMRRTAEKINWMGTALFAAPDRRIALFYTHQRIKGFSAGIDLIYPVTQDAPIEFILIGGSSQREALEKLYGPGGFIYTLEGKDFIKEQGLGSMEAVSYRTQEPLCKEKISSLEEIERYVDKGLIRLVWIPS